MIKTITFLFHLFIRLTPSQQAIKENVSLWSPADWFYFQRQTTFIFSQTARESLSFGHWHKSMFKSRHAWTQLLVSSGNGVGQDRCPKWPRPEWPVVIDDHTAFPCSVGLINLVEWGGPIPQMTGGQVNISTCPSRHHGDSTPGLHTEWFITRALSYLATKTGDPAYMHFSNLWLRVNFSTCLEIYVITTSLRSCVS